MQVSNYPFIDRCLREAIAATADDRRKLRRYPFFRPITITLGDETLYGFGRDVSRGGMGLLHSRPLEAGRSFQIKLPTAARHLHLTCVTKWCVPIDDQLYSSGGSFESLSIAASLALVSEVVGEEINRRVQQRYPFFRPITIVGGRGATLPGFCRDISRGGMGLLHKRPLTPGRVIANIPDAEGDGQAISLDVRWCVPTVQDWYLSGAKFARVWLEEIPVKLM